MILFHVLICHLHILSNEMSVHVFFSILFSSVQSLSHVQLFAILWTTTCQASLSITNFWSLLRFMSLESVMPLPSHPLLSPSIFSLPPSVFPSIRVFSKESFLRIRWSKYWNFSFSVSPSKEYSGLISFRIDWLDLLAVQGAPKGLLQYHSSKASIPQHSAFFIVQLSHPYLTTGKTIALTWLVGLVAKSCLTLADPMDRSLPSFSVHGILQVRILEWVAISSSRGSSQPRNQT